MISLVGSFALGQGPFFGWVTLKEQKWVTFRERRGIDHGNGPGSATTRVSNSRWTESPRAMVVDSADRSFPLCPQSQPVAQPISAHQLDPGRGERTATHVRGGPNNGWVSLARYR